MPRIRHLKHDFFLDEDVAQMSPLARLLFAGLWVIADREGRIEDRPARIKVQVLPYDDADAETLLAEICSHDFILRYQSEGRNVIQIRSFHRHQRPHKKEAESSLPPPNPGNYAACREKPGKAAEFSAGMGNGEWVMGNGERVMGMGGGEGVGEEETTTTTTTIARARGAVENPGETPESSPDPPADRDPMKPSEWMKDPEYCRRNVTVLLDAYLEEESITQAEYDAWRRSAAILATPEQLERLRVEIDQVAVARAEARMAEAEQITTATTEEKP